MYTDIVLEQKAENFMRHLGLTPKGNYFTCYQFSHPILDLLFLGPLVEGIVTKIVLIIATEEELIIKKIGSGLSPVDIKEKTYDKNIIRIPKSDIVNFEMKDWVILGYDLGYLLTVETDRKYYFRVAKVTGYDFSTINFFNLKANNFFDLVTENNTK
ncbi:hypothetical protein ACFC4I_06095 [Enterococcus durans]|uniref:hypothetical protein n=1 Tax=Enterococcus durans TaxID=53345 RepID=UPI0035DE9254